MDAIVQKVGDILIAQGLPGVVIMGLAYALKVVFQLYIKSQEARLEEGKAVVKALEASTAAQQALADAIRNR